MDTRLNIVVVEDHNRLRNVTVQVLTDVGHYALGLSCAEEVEDALGRFVPDLFVIDIGLPGEDGLSLCSRLRASHPSVGIIMATARSDLHDKVQGYACGVDIYLPKPVDVAELLAVVSALARRVKNVSVADADTALTLHEQTLTGPAHNVSLTQHEALLLAALARAPRQTLEHWQVALNLGHASDEEPSKSSIEVRVARLRKKLALVSGNAQTLKAIRLQGYKLYVVVRVQ
jgi:DNA-binding response OmpR family regulator